MTHHCECGHLPSEHDMGWGRCSGECWDADYGTFGCMCFHYEKDRDD